MRWKEGLLAGLRSSAPVAILLLVSAGLVANGTWLWSRGLAFVGVFWATSILSSIALATWRPASFAVRRQSVVAPEGRKQPMADAIGSALLIVYLFGWLVFIPVDVFQLHLLPAPGPIAVAVGAAGVLLGAALNHLAIWENAFASPNLQDQAASGQRVIDTGVYGLMRHPIYAANLILFGGAAVWLGSYAALLGLGVLLLATMGRIAMEERHLRANLPGYADYAGRVRARLIPFVI